MRLGICLLVFLFTLNLYAQHESSTTSDDSYGRGGKNITSTYKASGGEHEEENIYDANNILRERKLKSIYKEDLVPRKEGDMVEVHTYYDCKGQKLYDKISITDKNGKERSFEETMYKNGMVVAGIRRFVDSKGKNHKHKYVGKSGKDSLDEWEEVTETYSDASLPNGNYQVNHTSCPADKDEIFIGFSLINEDSYTRFNTYGGNASYTFFFNPKFGVTADAGVNFGSQGIFDYRKISFMAGPTCMPFQHAGKNDKLGISLHVLAGITNLQTKFGTMEASNSNFSLDVGPGFNFALSRKIGIGIRAGYNPVFTNGSNSTNYRISAGIVFR